MATTLAQKAALAIDTTFIAQIKMQIIYEANYQLTAPKPASSQIKYDKLMSLSKSIIQSPDSNAIVFANKIAATTALTAPVSDANVGTEVASAFGIIAGVQAGE